MEVSLTLYTYKDSKESLFLIGEEPIEIGAFTYNAKRMGGAPSITATIRYKKCLDLEWTGNEFVKFNGEKYYLKNIPSSSYDNTDIRYKHECTFVSERIILENVYVYDVVSASFNDDKPVSNSSNFTFFGDVNGLINRLNESLKYSKIDYNIVVDGDVTSEAKMVSFQDQYFINALQGIYNTYDIPYYFKGKEIHIGYSEQTISDVFEYGIDNQLLSISKNNANYKTVNRITGIGSSENIPYYYPNETSKGVIEVVASEGNRTLNKYHILVDEDRGYNKLADNLSLDSKVTYYATQTAIASVTKCEIQRYDDSWTPIDIDDAENLDFIDWFSETRPVIKHGTQKNETIRARVTFDIEITGRASLGINLTAEGVNGLGWPTQKKDETCFVYLDGKALNTYNVSVSKHSETYSYNNILKFVINLDDVDVGSHVVTVEALYVPVTDNVLGQTLLVSFYPLLPYFEEQRSYHLKTSEGKIVTESQLGIKLDINEREEEQFVGDSFYIKQVSYINPQPNLMPYVYRESSGAERFYNAINDESSQYTYDNPYIEGKPLEHLLKFDDIKPSIKSVANIDGYQIDMFSDFAYDVNDNNDVDEEGNFIHPYFFGKLRKLDFNLFDHAIESGEMTVSMTSGHCGGCNFVVGVSNDENQKNLVQVDENGNLKRDEYGNVICGRENAQESVTPQDNQNDTINNEVWIALKKDKETFGENAVMPSKNIKPQACQLNNNDGDTFVFINIDLPKEYVIQAEKTLEEKLIKYMAENNAEKFNFSIKFSRIYFATLGENALLLNENSKIKIRYNGLDYNLYVSSYSYKISQGDILPEITVELSDTITITQNAIMNAVSEVKFDMMGKITQTNENIIQLAQSTSYSSTRSPITVSDKTITIKKDVEIKGGVNIRNDATIQGDAYVNGKVEARSVEASNNVTVGKYVGGVSGAIITEQIDGKTYLEVDNIRVRAKAFFEELQIQKSSSIGGKLILTPAGSIKCIKVVSKKELEANYGLTDLPEYDFYRCYFQNEQNDVVIDNYFQIGDQAYSKSFNISENSTSEYTNRYYWRLVVGVGEDYIDLSNYNSEDGSYVGYDNDSDIPATDDVICHLGNRTEKERQNAIIISTVEAQSPSIILFSGINSFSLDGKEVVQMGVDSNNDAFFNVGGSDSKQFLKYSQNNGLNISGTLSVDSLLGEEKLSEYILKEAYNASEIAKSYADEIVNGVQQQIDGVVESYFEEGVPTNENYPAFDWITDEDKANHLGDTYTNISSYEKDPDNAGKSWRWTYTDSEHTDYHWHPIADSDAVKALLQAKDAKDTADTKRRVFTSTPTNEDEYDEGDLWVNASFGEYNNDILRCKEAKLSGEAFSISHWRKASKYTDDTAAEEAKNEIAGYEYLKEALKGTTEITSGLILSSLIQLRNGTNNVMSGVNGTTPNGDSSIAFWAGGEMDEEKATFVVRMDGSGFFSNGQISWDKDGNLWFADDVKVGDDENLASIISKISTLNKAVADHNTTIEEHTTVLQEHETEITKIQELFTLEEKDDGSKAIRANHTLYSVGGISALGLGEDGSDTSSSNYDRLDSWDNYDEEAGDVLSAKLGYELKEAIESIDLGDFDLSGYATEEWVKDNYANLEYSVQSFGKINLGMISYTELYNIMKALPSDTAIRMYLITDSSGNLPSTSGETAITITDTYKKLLFGKTANFGVSVGDILVVTKKLLKIIPLNEAKAVNGDFPGADGLESVWDKGQINRIPTIESLAYAALPKADRLPSLSATNMDQALQTGVYPWCTLGRPYGSTGAYTCIVNRSSTDDGAYDTIEQTAYGRQGESGQIYKRIIFYKTDGTDTQYGEWREITNVSADKNYVHEQGTAATDWHITHNLNKYPSATIMDSANSMVIGEVEYVDMNNVILHFSAEFSGRATLN